MKFLEAGELQSSFPNLFANLHFSQFFISTASNVKARHELLEAAIGTFQQEKDAYALVMLLSWLLPCILMAGAVIDAVLVWVYMKYCHPWIGILSKEKKVEKRVAKNENRSLSFYEEAVEEVLISVRGDQSATRSDVSGQEVLQQSSVPISGATTSPTENQLQSEAEA